MDESAPALHCWDLGSRGYLVIGTFVPLLVSLGNTLVEEFEDCLVLELALARRWDCNLGREDPDFYSSCLASAERLPVFQIQGLHDWLQSFFLP